MQLKAMLGLGTACLASAAAFDPVSVLREKMTSGDVIGRDLKKRSLDPYDKNFALKNPKKCPKPFGGADVEDRYCESTFQPAPACGCKEVCHVWGDPHVSPFFSSCSEVSMRDVGDYILYELPANDDPNRIPIRIETKVTKASKWKFPRQLTITYGDSIVHPETLEEKTYNNKVVMTHTMCKDDPNAYFKQVFPLYTNKRDTSETVLLSVESNCNSRHAWHLNTTITFFDNLSGADSENINTLLDTAQSSQIYTTRTADALPPSTVIFDDDFGVCTDPLKYSNLKPDYGDEPFWMNSEECKRPSGLSDGRECSCNQQCAAYGDPHIHAFNEVPEKGNDFFADVEEPEFRVLYSVAPFYSAVVKVDECAYMTGFYGIYLKDDPPFPADLSNPKNYHIAEYDAETECADEASVAKTTRKTIHAPQMAVDGSVSSIAAINAAVYDHSLSGFSTGKFWVDSEGAAHAIPQSNQADLLSYLSAAGADASSVITSGGVQAALKCHKTRTTKKFPERKYFNVCIQRTGINVDAAPTDDSRRILSGAQLINDPGAKGLLEVEKVLKSAGWCATGAALNRKKSRFSRRKQKQINVFPYNPEIARTN